MRWKVVIFLFISLFLMFGCTVQGLYSGYNNLSDEEKKKVTDISTRTNISEISNFDSVYLITPETLKKAMLAHNRNVIYVWNPLCSASTCLHPAIAKAEIEEKGYKFWLVAAFFSKDVFNINLDTPVYGIKESIHRKIASKYLRNFAKEFGCESYDFESFIVFENHSCQCMDNISLLPTQNNQLAID